MDQALIVKLVTTNKVFILPLNIFYRWQLLLCARIVSRCDYIFLKIPTIFPSLFDMSFTF